MDIILYLLNIIQYLYRQNCWLINFICRYIPLKQWAFDDSHSPKYQKFTIDKLPLFTYYQQGWTYKDLILYYEKRYGKRRSKTEPVCFCRIKKRQKVFLENCYLKGPVRYYIYILLPTKCCCECSETRKHVRHLFFHSVAFGKKFADMIFEKKPLNAVN